MATKSSKSLAITTVVGLSVMMAWIAGIGWNSYPLFANAIIEEFSCTRTEFTLSITLVNVVNGLISMFVYGRMVDKMGMRNYMTMCMIVGLLAFSCFALAQNVWMLWLGGCLFGFSSAGLSINTINVVVDRWFLKDQGKYVSIPQVANAIAGIIYASICAALIAAFGWRIPFWIIVGLGIIAFFVLRVLYKGDPKDLGVEPVYADEISATADSEAQTAALEDEGGITYGSMFKTYQFWCMALGYFGSGLLAFAIMSNLALFASDFGFGDKSGIIMSCALVAQAISFIVAGKVIDKLGSKWCILINAIAIVISCVIFMMSEISVVLMFVGAALVGFNAGSAQMPMAASVREAFGRKEFAKKMGTVTSFTLFGFAFGPSILNIFFDMSGTYQLGLTAMIVCAVVTVLLMFVATRPAKITE